MAGYRIALLPGDGIGPEVTREAVRALEAAAGGLALEFEPLEAGAECYRRQGTPLPEATLARAAAADAILLGAMGLPDVRWPDGTEMAPQVDLRCQLDLYAGIRPARGYRGVPPVLAGHPPEGIDFVLVRESTEGLFAARGGGARVGEAVAADTQIITRAGTERVCRAAFDWCRQRRAAGRPGRVTCVDKANILPSMAFFRRVFQEVAAGYPDIEAETLYVDAAALRMVRAPESFDVLVTENMFGDILSDLAAGLVGGLGLAPSADVGDCHAVFQPVHGTAPDIAGRGIANPLAAILSAAMLLDWLGRRRADAGARAAAARIETAVARGLAAGDLRAPDLGGTLSTTAIGDRVIRWMDERQPEGE